MSFTTIAVGGFTSNSGKTGLVCELLRAFPGWEAIKVSRGHYRSCGKDPQSCCVSPLLGAEPVLRSGRAETYATGKDTGRYWDAGAANVHWLIVTDAQVERGIHAALARVRAPGVIIEGNSFQPFARVDFALMAARGDGVIKPTARRALEHTSAFYLSDDDGDDSRVRFDAWRARCGASKLIAELPIYTRAELPRLCAQVRAIHAAVAAA